MNVFPDILVGHAQNIDACTGCTVLIGPFRAAADVRGMATGSREIDVLSPLHVVEKIDALVLTGGSAFGLAAADGVMHWLADHGYGYDTGVARIPIVPAAVIFDLGVGRADVFPDAAMGRAACDAAVRGNDAQGGIGAGTGATAGKLLGVANATRTGIGVSGAKCAGYYVNALAVVNPLGDVLDGGGQIIAGARDAQGDFADSRRLLASTPATPTTSVPLATPLNAEPATNTTLVAVATDAPLSRVDLAKIARIASTGIARRIAPVNTPFDGDVVFALSTSADAEIVSPALILALGSAAATAVEEAIEQAARTKDR